MAIATHIYGVENSFDAEKRLARYQFGFERDWFVLENSFDAEKRLAPAQAIIELQARDIENSFDAEKRLAQNNSTHCKPFRAS